MTATVTTTDISWDLVAQLHDRVRVPANPDSWLVPRFGRVAEVCSGIDAGMVRVREDVTGHMLRCRRDTLTVLGGAA